MSEIGFHVDFLSNVDLIGMIVLDFFVLSYSSELPVLQLRKCIVLKEMVIAGA